MGHPHTNDFVSSTTPDKRDGSESSLRKTNRLQNQMMGTNGAKAFVPATGAVTPATGHTYFCAIQCVQECVFAALASNITNGSTLLVGVVIPAGTVLVGLFTSATLTSGLAIAYND